MLGYDSIEELVRKAEKAHINISDLVLEDQAQLLERDVEDLIKEMESNIQVMEKAIDATLNGGIRSTSGLSGDNAHRLHNSIRDGKSIAGSFLDTILIRALAIAEANACMKRIVAAPTAGSCGILPAVLLTARDKKNIPHLQVIMGLFTAAGIGMVIAKKACISGADGGCQAECGSAAAMAAGALVEILGGNPRMVANACAISLKSVLGLVCDPVAGLVEIPCIKRNALGASNAVSAAQLAIAGIESVIPADEVIEAMREVGDVMAPTFKETGKGGLAATPTGRRIARLFYKNIDEPKG